MQLEEVEQRLLQHRHTPARAAHRRRTPQRFLVGAEGPLVRVAVADGVVAVRDVEVHRTAGHRPQVGVAGCHRLQLRNGLLEVLDFQCLKAALHQRRRVAHQGIPRLRRLRSRPQLRRDLPLAPRLPLLLRLRRLFLRATTAVPRNQEPASQQHDREEEPQPHAAASRHAGRAVRW